MKLLKSMVCAGAPVLVVAGGAVVGGEQDPGPASQPATQSIKGAATQAAATHPHPGANPEQRLQFQVAGARR